MIVKQDKLIKDIAEQEDVSIATVRDIFKSAEEKIFGYLSSATPTENVVVKIFDGLKLECKYIPEKKIHTYADIICKPRIWARPKITRYYNQKLNKVCK